MRIDRLLYFALLLLLPTQLSKYYFPQALLINGRRIDYVALSIYFTEIILIVMFFLFIKKTGFTKIKKPKRAVIVLIGIILFSILLSINPFAGFIKVIKIMELFLFGLYIYLSRPSFSKSITVLLFSGVFVCVLAIAQFYFQHSLGGIMYFIGERVFSISTPNIAKSAINGQLLLR
ncbi:hypothetical protein HYT02_01240, partial [Candidatus Gottesmanbacteria bacterium]|nr:hypothetical protein [Candidatus Gottesmanbacteria bacterium]